MTPDDDDRPGRLLAIDYGHRRMGLAMSDPTRTFAVGLETLAVTGKTDVLATLAALCQQYRVERVYVGLPRRLDGREGDSAQRVRAFVTQLQDILPAPVALLDERLTSVIAGQHLQAQGLSPSRHKALVDQAAACLMLQEVLDRENRPPAAEATSP
jgi:putative Holliday junction resolvase